MQRRLTDWFIDWCFHLIFETFDSMSVCSVTCLKLLVIGQHQCTVVLCLLVNILTMSHFLVSKSSNKMWCHWIDTKHTVHYSTSRQSTPRTMIVIKRLTSVHKLTTFCYPELSNCKVTSAWHSFSDSGELHLAFLFEWISNTCFLKVSEQ